MLNGCAVTDSGTVKWQQYGTNEIVWPKSSTQARIRFLRSITPFESQGEQGRSLRERALRWLVGENRERRPLRGPYGVTADGKGRVWVADTGGGAVHVYDLANSSIEYVDVAGTYSLISPVDVAWGDDLERLYISDPGLKTVFVLDGENGFLDSLAPPHSFVQPTSLALDETGNLYVLDTEAARIEIFSSDGTHLRSLDTEIPGFPRLNSPSNMAVDGLGRIYLTDSFNFRIVVISPEGRLLTTIGQLGDAPGSFARPRGLAVDSDGHIYVADAAFDNIQIFDLAGQLLLHWGQPGSGAGEFCLPAGIFIDRHDRIYVVDSCNFRVQVFQYLKGGEGGKQ